jgi:hypothetical protein
LHKKKKKKNWTKNEHHHKPNIANNPHINTAKSPKNNNKTYDKMPNNDGRTTNNDTKDTEADGEAVFLAA